MADYSLPLKHLFNGSFSDHQFSAPQPTSLISPIDSKKTKIVATIGPATETEEKIKELILAGMNVARFNTKHNQPLWHQQAIQRVRKVAAQLNVPIGILIDLQGPEIRVTLKQAELNFKKNSRVVFTSADLAQNEEEVVIPANVVQTLNVGNHILLDDGACHFVIVEKKDNHLTAECLEDCIVRTRKTLNTPNVIIDMPALLPEDEYFLDQISPENIDFVALSFVRSTQDITHLRNVLLQKQISAQVVAKIENRKAIENLESIILASDGVMIARGDLAVEVNFEEVIYWQKKIIRLCQKYAKPVITATQMLLSMVEKPTPTRAEISDVANAVYDGTDAVMLSEETTIGKFPTKAVKVQAKIVEFYERHTSECLPTPESNEKIPPLLQSTLEVLKKDQKAIEKVVVICDELTFIQQLSSFRFKAPLLALTNSLQLSQKLCLSYGVQPLYAPNLDFQKESINQILDILKSNQKLSLGEHVLILYNLIQSEGTSNLPLLREVI